MGKLIKIFDYQMLKMREAISRQKEEFTERSEKYTKHTDEMLQKIRDDHAEFERKWFKALKGGKL